MRHLLAPLLLTLWTLPLLPTHLADAQQVQSIFASRAQDGAASKLSIHPGYGLNLFFQTGEKIKKAWLDDPTQIALDFDAKPPAATLIHLRNISGLQFPGLRRSPDRTTLLSVLMDSGNLYQFQLMASEGMPNYTTMAIVADNRGTPMIDISAYRRGSLDDVERGLQVAQARKLMGNSIDMASRVMNFIALVRNGESLTTAASKAGVSMAVITKLADMGQNSSSASVVPGVPNRRHKPIPPLSKH